MTRPGIEPRSPGPLANALNIMLNINYSIQPYSFICKQSNGFKYFYVILIILFNMRFQVFHTNRFLFFFWHTSIAFVFTQLDGFNRCYPILILFEMNHSSAYSEMFKSVAF